LHDGLTVVLFNGFQKLLNCYSAIELQMLLVLLTITKLRLESTKKGGKPPFWKKKDSSGDNQNPNLFCYFCNLIPTYENSHRFTALPPFIK